MGGSTKKGVLMLIVWRWKKDVSQYIGKGGVAGISVQQYPGQDGNLDTTLFGRDGYVGFEYESLDEYMEIPVCQL